MKIESAHMTLHIYCIMHVPEMKKVKEMVNYEKKKHLNVRINK